MISIKHTLASSSDSKATISNVEMRKLINKKLNIDEVTLYYHDYNCSITYHPSRHGQTWYANMKFPPLMTLPKIGQPLFYNVSVVVDDTVKSLELKNEFEPIRLWAKERGLYELGNVKTQTIKLQEEVGELAKAVLKEDLAEIQDAIGDSIIVLTNLAELANLKVEDCINKAYSQIKNRKGSMNNGTFVKHGS